MVILPSIRYSFSSLIQVLPLMVSVIWKSSVVMEAHPQSPSPSSDLKALQDNLEFQGRAGNQDCPENPAFQVSDVYTSIR